MNLEYNLTIGNLYKANVLLSLYRIFKPILLMTTLFFIFTIFMDMVVAFFYGVPLGIILGFGTSLIVGIVVARRNKHYAGKRTLILSKEGYKYAGESFSREMKWSGKIKNWYTPWYIFIDVTSLYPIIVKRAALTESEISQLREILHK